MSRLDELLKQYCPNGVEYKPVKEVYTRLRGTPITAGKMKEIENPEGDIRIFAGGKTVISAFEEDIPNANITRVPAVLVQSRGVIDFVYYDKPFTFKNEMWAYTCDEQVSLRYLWHVLKNDIPHFRKAAEGMGSLPQISLPVTEDFVIPVPPLAVQEEIVRILDSFTELEAGLEAGLEAELLLRKQQYEWYRDDVLSFEGDVEWKPISEVILSLKTGLNPRKNFKLNEDGATCYYVTGKDVYDNNINISERTDKITQEAVDLINRRACLHDDVLMFVSTGTGTVGRMTVVDKYTGDWNVSETMYIITVDNEQILTRYLFHLLYSAVTKNQFEPKITTGSVPHLRVADLLAVKVPVPSLKEQECIVNLLDRFDALCTDITAGLPAEITARQKQYEYYRDKLLSFEVTT